MATESSEGEADIVNVLTKREDERMANVLKRRDEREKAKESVTEESYTFFIEKFNKLIGQLTTQLQECDTMDKSLLPQHFDVIASNVAEVQCYIGESAVFLRSYDVRKAQIDVADFQAKFQECKIRVMPKKKFAFRAKGTTTEKKTEKQTDTAPVVSDVKNTPAENNGDLCVTLANCKFTDKTGECLTKYGDEITNKDVALVNLRDCVIKLYGSPSVLHINGLVNCTVLCGPVRGSMFIRACEKCVFVVACQQLRIHTTTHTQFYMHVTSRAIIEDCSTIKVAKYHWSYPELDDDYKTSGLDRNVNNWDRVDDFNWLSDKPSPNWSILETDNVIQVSDL